LQPVLGYLARQVGVDGPGCGVDVTFSDFTGTRPVSCCLTQMQ
jgi:hypothetical protein